MAFKTQFNFRLPRGYVDAEGNVHRDGVMRLATARDEILPLQDYRVQSNRAYLVLVLLSRVITKIGEHTHITVDMIENLFSTDLAYLQEFYRKINEEGGAPKHHVTLTVRIGEVTRLVVDVRSILAALKVGAGTSTSTKEP